MVDAVRVKCSGISNGFRSPLSQSVQDTLPLPTPTQLIGLYGAAAGISRAGIKEVYKKLKVGIVGTHTTTFQDLTRIIKYASGGRIKKSISLLMRENLFNSSFMIWYIPTSDISVSDIKSAFKNPAYALSLGRDDEIIRIDEIKEVKLRYADKGVLIQNTVVPFTLDPSMETVVESEERMIPLSPIPLPRSFNVDDKFVRTPQEMTQFTFIEGYKIESQRKGALDDSGIQFFPI